VVALSSCEAEYIVGSEAAYQAVWLAQLIGEMLGKQINPPLIKIDNRSAIALSKNPVLHKRSKHIKTKFHFIWECIDQGEISLEAVSTADQLADILTKALVKVRFQDLRGRIGVIKLQSTLN
jgi:ABC-type hemin transport system ATPase subunit